MMNLKQEIRNKKNETSLKYGPKPKLFDLEDRTLAFAKNVRKFVKQLPNTAANREDIRQLIRSSGSVGANYLEANESLSKKDFLMRIKIAKKEARETIWWLRLLENNRSTLDECIGLQKESTEIMNILGAIARNSK